MRALILTLLLLTVSAPTIAGPCDTPDQLDSAGHRCGGRSASEKPGGK